MKYKVRLIEIQGDQEEFADLIGESGDLQLHETNKSHELNWFNPNHRGDSLSFNVKKKVEKDNKIIVYSSLGNIFVFLKTPT